MKKAIIRINVELYPEEIRAITEQIVTQWEEHGIVILAPWCDVFIVDDAEIVGGTT